MAEGSEENHEHFLNIGDSVGYDDATREYFIVIKRHGAGLTERQSISFCPICGKKLPSSLRDDWLAQLEAVGVDHLNDDIPKIFLDGTWWRGS